MMFMKLNNDFSSATTDFDARFTQLLAAWNAHQDIHFGEADSDALWSSRQRLAAARASLRG